MASRTTMAIVALLLSAPAALAQDQLMKENLLTLAVTLAVYDDRCEQLAPKLRADLQRLARMLDEGGAEGGLPLRTEEGRRCRPGAVVCNVPSDNR